MEGEFLAIREEGMRNKYPRNNRNGIERCRVIMMPVSRIVDGFGDDENDSSTPCAKIQRKPTIVELKPLINQIKAETAA